MEGEADFSGGACVDTLRALRGYTGGSAGPGTRNTPRGACRPPRDVPGRFLTVPAGRRGAFEPPPHAIPGPRTPRGWEASRARRMTPSPARRRVLPAHPAPGATREL